MPNLLWLLPALPLASSVLLVLFGPRLSRRVVAVLGAGSVGAAAVLAIWMASRFFAYGGAPYRERAWTWLEASGLHVDVSFHLDALSLTMTLVVTIVGFLIHLYATEHMYGTEGYSRFFAYMNLFVAAMLILVLASDLVVLYLGWEGVGLCSFLLIGFDYAKRDSVEAARKAFIVTRIGDVAFALGLLWLFRRLGTFDIGLLNARSATAFQVGATEPTLIAMMLLGGAVGKSAQLPLQTWLPDAMAGPTPTSALIHAATMVTAGVYLLARLTNVFAMAPMVMALVAAIGMCTMLLSAVSAMVQSDIKRVLAYSTMSQIGLMFIALGVGAWEAAIFHLVTHACFKALLFLSAGIVIDAMHHEHDIFRMGGLWRHLPTAWAGFMVGGAALAGLPLVSSGYYSKDRIVWATWASPQGSAWLWGASVLGACLTAIYVTRLVYRVFWGRLGMEPSLRIGTAIRIPIYVLGALSIAAGFLNIPDWLTAGALGRAPLETSELHVAARQGLTERASGMWASLAFAVGVGAALLALARRRVTPPEVPPRGAAGPVYEFWKAGWDFDWLYELSIVRPFLSLARAVGRDEPDQLFEGTSRLVLLTSAELGKTQTGRMRWYAAGIVAGTALLLAIVVWRP